MPNTEPLVLFLRPWVQIPGKFTQFFEQELAKELPPHHDLCRKMRAAVAITVESDDVLFELDDGQYAQVHLTYTTSSQSMSDFPATGSSSRCPNGCWP